MRRNLIGTSCVHDAINFRTRYESLRVGLLDDPFTKIPKTLEQSFSGETNVVLRDLRRRHYQANRTLDRSRDQQPKILLLG